MTSDDWTMQLRSQGRRVTRQRLAVLAAVRDHPHSSAEQIAQLVRAELPSISTQSVYVVLTDLTALEMLRKFEPPGRPALYETRTGDNHHHACCVRCGRIEDVDCAIGSAPCLTPSEDYGMVLLSADVLYRGICRGCQAAAAAQDAPAGTAPQTPGTVATAD